jgi:hypothetical protein
MLRVTALSDKSDLDVRFDLFERLNTGGIALSPQEVRACVYKGKFREVLRDLASDQPFADLLKLQQKRKNDGTKEEQVLKFFAYLEDRESFRGAVKAFLNKNAERLSKEDDFAERVELFHKTVRAIAHLTDGAALLRPGLSITPLNQFEAVLVAAAEEILSGNNNFDPKEGWLSDKELVEASTGATNTQRMLEGRISRARELLRGAEVVPTDVVDEAEQSAED